MNKYKKGLVGLTVGSLIYFFGCSGIIKNALITKDKPKDMRLSVYRNDIEKAADKKFKSTNPSDLIDVIKGYGSICETKKMDKTVKKLISENIDLGMSMAETAQEYHRMCGK